MKAVMALENIKSMMWIPEIRNLSNASMFGCLFSIADKEIERRIVCTSGSFAQNCRLLKPKMLTK